MQVDKAAWLRVFIREQPRAGLKEDVQDLFPRALEVRIDVQALPELATPARPEGGASRSPRELFAEYLTAKGVADEAVGELFNELYEEVLTG
jgi:DNA repair protein SbcD/Mre11